MNDTDEDKLAKAQNVLDMLDTLFAEKRNEISLEQIDQACTIYAKALIIKARITSKGETT